MKAPTRLEKPTGCLGFCSPSSRCEYLYGGFSSVVAAAGVRNCPVEAERSIGRVRIDELD
jgi:hypothetical protein